MTLLHPLPVNGPYSSFWLLSKAIVNTLTAVHTSIAETGGRKQGCVGSDLDADI